LKIVCLSDSHCRLRKISVPDGDLLLHAGDLTFKGDHQEIHQELRELGRIAKNFKYGCVFVAGNHDWLAERDPGLMRQMAIDEGLIYLDHSSIQIEGLNIFGSAYTPEFCNWAFNVPRGQSLAKKWARIPDDTNILITHGPAMGILDVVERFDPKVCNYYLEHVGCADLNSRIQDLKELQLHIFGHLHLGYGQQKIGNTMFVNASVCTEQYKPTNPIFTIDI
jgi:Icc-related predicted phosphoesterase